MEFNNHLIGYNYCNLLMKLNIVDCNETKMLEEPVSVSIVFSNGNTNKEEWYKWATENPETK